MQPKRGNIPLCRSEFLQDLTIALGRGSLKSIRYSSKLTFDVSHETVNGVTQERLEIEARCDPGTLTKILVWDDGVFWVYFIDRSQGPREPAFPRLNPSDGYKTETATEYSPASSAVRPRTLELLGRERRAVNNSSIDIGSCAVELLGRERSGVREDDAADYIRDRAYLVPSL